MDGDVYAAGQRVTISGDVTGGVIAAAQTITLTGRVDGSVRLAARDRLTIDGTVGGDADYTSDRTARIAAGSVDGTVDRVQATSDTRAEVSPASTISSWLLGLLYALITLSLVTFAGAPPAGAAFLVRAVLLLATFPHTRLPAHVGQESKVTSDVPLAGLIADACSTVTM